MLDRPVIPNSRLISQNNNRMLRRKCEYVWKFLRENNCDDAIDNITNGMRCTICGNVMINAHIGGCGCRYCLECVTAYLNGESRFCPGKGDDCKQDLMVMDETVLPDHAMNQKISKLVVKCFRDGCKFRGALGKMEKHDRMCEKRVTKCPYCDIGCLQNPLVKDEVKEHLSDGNESHAALLMQFIGNLKNENQLMKEEIASLRSTIETNRTEIAAQMMVNDQEIRAQGQTQAENIEILRAKCLLVEEKMNEFQRLNRKRKAERDKDIDIAHNKYSSCGDVTMQVRVENRERGEFVWRIDRWAARRQAARVYDSSKQEIFSEAFFLHEQGHRMCLSVWPYGYCGENENLCLRLHLMRGPFDQHLDWPFDGDVTLSVINQDTQLDYTSFTVKYIDNDQYHAYETPTSERNDGIGSHGTVIDVDELSRNPAVCRNDQILIRCIVEMLD